MYLKAFLRDSFSSCVNYSSSIYSFWQLTTLRLWEFEAILLLELLLNTSLTKCWLIISSPDFIGLLSLDM